MDYAIYDVFTTTPLAGNPLAVVFDADGLSPEAMQALAREFNLSETVFLLKPDNASHGARLKIFTPVHELPFAGHPTVGAAIALAHRMAGADDAKRMDLDTVLMLEETVGDIRCVVRQADGGSANGRLAFAEFDLPRLSSPVACDLDREAVADALGIATHRIGFENHVISTWSAGVPYVLVPAHDRSTVGECDIDPKRWNDLAPIDGGKIACPYVYCRGGVDHRAGFHARMFAASSGIYEDPATGSAVAALSGALHDFDGLLDGHHALIVEQGVEMGRPSIIHLHVDVANGALAKTRIGGHAIRVAQGTLDLRP